MAAGSSQICDRLWLLASPDRPPDRRPFVGGWRRGVSRRMRTGVRRAQCIRPRRKNFDGGDWRRVSRQKSVLETGMRQKCRLRAAEPRKSPALQGGARICQFRESGWWRTQAPRTGLRREIPCLQGICRENRSTLLPLETSRPGIPLNLGLNRINSLLRMAGNFLEPRRELGKASSQL